MSLAEMQWGLQLCGDRAQLSGGGKAEAEDREAGGAGEWKVTGG